MDWRHCNSLCRLNASLLWSKNRSLVCVFISSSPWIIPGSVNDCRIWQLVYQCSYGGVYSYSEHGFDSQEAGYWWLWWPFSLLLWCFKCWQRSCVDKYMMKSGCLHQGHFQCRFRMARGDINGIVAKIIRGEGSFHHSHSVIGTHYT